MEMATESKNEKDTIKPVKLSIPTYIIVYLSAFVLYVIANAILMYSFNLKLGWLFTLLFFFWAPKKLLNHLKEKKEQKIVFRTPSESVDEQPAEDKILFCRKCGAKLLENAAFCNKCGTEIIKL